MSQLLKNSNRKRYSKSLQTENIIHIPFIPVYLENARSTTATTLAFTIATGGTWKIKVAQIECSNLARAYPDCDQFVTGATGTISSYNWPNIQLKAKDYQHCIRREDGN